MIVGTVKHNQASTQKTSVAPGTVRLIKSFTFEAAHRLPHMPTESKCYRLHGHSFKVDLICAGRPNAETGILVDFSEIKGAFDTYYEMLDHHYLNEVPGLENPTAENIAIWIWNKTKSHLPSLAEVRVHETCTSACEYGGE